MFFKVIAFALAVGVLYWALWDFIPTNRRIRNRDIDDLPPSRRRKS